jgi:hypothetical protein
MQEVFGECKLILVYDDITLVFHFFFMSLSDSIFIFFEHNIRPTDRLDVSIIPVCSASLISSLVIHLFCGGGGRLLSIIIGCRVVTFQHMLRRNVTLLDR